MTDVHRVLYRIVRAAEPMLDDFKSAKALGKPLRDPTMRREWEDGVSVYDSLNYAQERARVMRFKLGRYIAPLRVPDDGSVQVRQTSKDPHHFTIYGTAEQILALVAGEMVAVEDE